MRLAPIYIVIVVPAFTHPCDTKHLFPQSYKNEFIVTEFL